MRNCSVSEKIKCQKIDKYFYRSPEGTILKYSHYCIEKNCKTESSYNYENLKPIYCNKHKLEKMVNVKRNHKLCKDCEKGYLKKCNTPKCKYTIKNYKDGTRYMKLKIIKYLKENNIGFYMCRICSQIVDKKHFDTEEHIEKFNSVCKIKIDKSLEESFITIKYKFIDNRYNYIYTDLYFKKHIKDIILKNIDTNKYYKSYIIKKNMLEFNQGKRDPMFISEKHDSNNTLYDLENIEHLEKNKERNLKPYLIKKSSTEYDYKIKKIYEDIEKVNFKESGDSIYYINSVGCEIFITECQLLKGSNYIFENIPKIFYSSRVINVIKNKDQKCFIYCNIRKFLNNVDNHKDRISLKDKQIVKILEEELDFNFDNVKIKNLNKIEVLLETNIYVYTCDKNLKNRLPVYKSDKCYEKYLDLLLYEEHYMIINNILRFFYPDDKNKIFFCRNCCNKMYSQKKFDEHLQFCQTNKAQILMPSQNKYLKFKNLKNTIQHTSFIPHHYKVALVKTLICRAYRHCSSWLLFHVEIENITDMLMNNGYNLSLIENTVKLFLVKCFNDNNNADNTKYGPDQFKVFIKLPFIGDMSHKVSSSIKSCLNQIKCGRVGLIFSHGFMRLDNKFKFKDFQPKHLQSGVVYKIECNCGKVHIGETGQCIKTRFNEHIKTSGTNITEVGKHLACSPTCTISFEDVSILAYEHRMRKGRILESLYIQDFNLREILNDNLHSVPLYLFNIPQKR